MKKLSEIPIMNAPCNIFRLACKKPPRHGWMPWVAGALSLAVLLLGARHLLRSLRACRVCGCRGACGCHDAAVGKSHDAA